MIEPGNIDSADMIGGIEDARAIEDLLRAEKDFNDHVGAQEMPAIVDLANEHATEKPDLTLLHPTRPEVRPHISYEPSLANPVFVEMLYDGGKKAVFSLLNYFRRPQG